MSPSVAKLLWKYLRVHRHPRDPSEQRIFIGRYGRALTTRGVEDLFHRIRDAAGITNVRCSPHTFRHTFSTLYLEQGGAIQKLSRELGHSKVNTTEQYIKTLPLSVARQDHDDFSPVRLLKLGSNPRRRRERQVG